MKSDYNGNVKEDCQYHNAETLTVVEIYFDTPTFDKITLDAKTNFITKVSMVGGTLGLFSGFSIMSAIEVVYFVGKMVLKLYRRSFPIRN